MCDPRGLPGTGLETCVIHGSFTTGFTDSDPFTYSRAKGTEFNVDVLVVGLSLLIFLPKRRPSNRIF